MKKSLLLLLAILACYLPANAQISFGIKGGINQAWHSGSNADAPKMQGFSTSLAIYKRLGRFLEIGIEPGFVQRGTTERYGEGYTMPYAICCFGDCDLPFYEEMDNPYRGLKASYIQAPVMIRANLPLANNKLALFGKTGCGLSYLSSGYYGTMVYDETIFVHRPETEELRFSEEDGIGTNRWDWGIYNGIGIGYRLGFGMLSVEAEYYHGFRAVNENDAFKNRGINYSFGYLVNL